MTRRDLNRATLARQLLLFPSAEQAERVIARLAGLQAQQARPPFVGLWTRLVRFARADLGALLAARRVVRVTAMRGTLHLLTAADYVAWRGALQPALTRGLSVVKGRAPLDLPALMAAGRAFFRRREATFEDLREHLAARFEGDMRAMAYAIRLHVPLVQVPGADPWGYPASARFTLADSWLGRAVPVAPRSPRALVRRYLAAFGPASATDAQTWSGLKGLRDVCEAMRGELVTFSDERGRELFDLPDAPRPGGDVEAPVRFLPEFDNLVLGHDDRTRVLAQAHRRIVVTKNLQVRATFLVAGCVAGTWSVTRTKRVATLRLAPFGAVTKRDHRSLEEEGDRLLAFVEPDAATREVRAG